MNHVILDIDNTISDDGWRIRYIAWGHPSGDARYEEYHRRAGYDFAKHRHLVREQHPDATPVFMTGRPNKFREYTARWLEKNYLVPGRPYHLLMRNDGDARSAVLIKEEMLLAWLPHYGVELRSILGAYDDRKDIINMYRRHGVPAEVLAIHNKDAYEAPAPLPTAAA